MTHKQPTQPYATIGTHTADYGCYIAGHWGQHATEVLADLTDRLAPAENVPNPATYWTYRVLEARKIDNFDLLDWLTDDMTSALNMATTDGYWEWLDGELFLTPENLCAGCGNDIPDNWRNPTPYTFCTDCA